MRGLNVSFDLSKIVDPVQLPEYEYGLHAMERRYRQKC